MLKMSSIELYFDLSKAEFFPDIYTYLADGTEQGDRLELDAVQWYYDLVLGGHPRLSGLVPKLDK